jgi:hypothetical protein
MFISKFEYFFSGATGYGPGDKRRKPLQLSSMTYILDESDVLDDLKIINKNKAFSVSFETDQPCPCGDPNCLVWIYFFLKK